MPTTICARCGHPLEYEPELEGQEAICPGCENITLLVPYGPPEPAYDPLAPVEAAAGPAPALPTEEEPKPPPVPKPAAPPPQTIRPSIANATAADGIRIITTPGGNASGGSRKAPTRISTLQLLGIAFVIIAMAVGVVIVAFGPAKPGGDNRRAANPSATGGSRADAIEVSKDFVSELVRSSSGARFGQIEATEQEDRSWFVKGLVEAPGAFGGQKEWSIVLMQQGDNSWQRLYMSLGNKEIGDRSLTPNGRSEMVMQERIRLRREEEEKRRIAALAEQSSMEQERLQKMRAQMAAREAAEKDRRQAEIEARVVASQMKRARSGSATAQYDIGMRYLEGRGVEKDRAEALRWLKQSAERGNRDAKKKLGELGEGL